MDLMFKTVASAALTLTALVTPAMADPVYMIAQVQIEDHQRFFDEYGTSASPIMIESGARVLVASPTVDTLEGEWTGNWTVVVEFPSEEAAIEGWYNTDAYQNAKELRLANTTLNNLVIAPAFVPPAE